MAFDLFFRKQTKKDWSRSNNLVTLPPQSQLENPTRLTDAIDVAKTLNPNLQIKQRGRGAVVSKKWQW